MTDKLSARACIDCALATGKDLAIAADAAEETNDRVEDVLRRLICAEKGNDAHRLRLAAWWKANGRPERGEFVEVQCELAKGPPGIRCEKLEWNASDKMSVIPLLLPEWCFDLGTAGGKRIDVCCLASVGRHQYWCVASGIVAGTVDGRIVELIDTTRPEVWKPELKEREEKVFAANSGSQHKWAGDEVHRLMIAGREWKEYLPWFKCGFVASIICTAEDWLTHADAILCQEPVEQVALTTMLTANVRPNPAKYGHGFVWYLTGRKKYHQIDKLRVTNSVKEQNRLAVEKLLPLEFPGIAFILPSQRPFRDDILAGVAQGLGVPAHIVRQHLSLPEPTDE